ncbi:prolyl-tRNA editing enzyme YbaK/EbsC (Cys-tRNA(Pro) deacylase) [Pseudoduganella lurida]|uniref:Prolyl-tRNA editing enzyme YbaK/EbsC (Cys-tRNA(Pro) deacylase) n=1 Tax=Pseudoduganella lurida TaxID=1036180 RepID=A0A562RLZ9_9BURK|nr:YbaK/EbsC family protein [Pseudoduganella lurida]TWI70061.1 prolyl-tRNA editing enzyme YbaK/EbsC (Cys-tRNA(Pro) deacylase) [Pseudoduganella lurida]
MSLSSVKQFFAEAAPDITVIELGTSTATVALAADALGVTRGQIAKTLSMRLPNEIVLLVTRGDARLDNRKYKEHFGTKARMLESAAVEAQTGHPIGGVCPFGLLQPLRVFCDVSLRAFEEVLPAAGTPNSALRIAPERMAQLTGAQWIDVTANDASLDADSSVNPGTSLVL